MYSSTVHQIIFYGTKRQRCTHFRAQSCDFWVLFRFLLFDCNRAQSGSRPDDKLAAIAVYYNHDN
jgi:hypothetical protein